MDPLRRSLTSLLSLSLLALWLVPGLPLLIDRDALQPAQLTTPTLAVETTPAPLALLGELEVHDDEPPARRGGAGDERDPQQPIITPTIAPDRATLDRSAGPIYRVRRSGQAHRSAP